MQTFMILVTYTVKPGLREAFLNDIAASGILDQIHKEDGCLCYEYYCPVQKKDSLLLIEKWTSSQHQEQHMQQPHMEKLKEIKERYVNSTQIERYFPE